MLPSTLFKLRRKQLDSMKDVSVGLKCIFFPRLFNELVVTIGKKDAFKNVSNYKVI